MLRVAFRIQADFFPDSANLSLALSLMMSDTADAAGGSLDRNEQRGIT
jgi:hypothetical protein